MAAYFFDTNAIVKWYEIEPGSDWVYRVMGQRNPAPSIFISELARVEVPSTFYKIERENHKDPALTNWALNRFERQLRLSDPARLERVYEIISVTPDILQRAAQLLATYRSGTPHALRSLDAIQLACAIAGRDTLPVAERSAIRFVTVDRQVRGVAAHEQFDVVNPVAPSNA